MGSAKSEAQAIAALIRNAEGAVMDSLQTERNVPEDADIIRREGTAFECERLDAILTVLDLMNESTRREVLKELGYGGTQAIRSHYERELARSPWEGVE